jgi:hypothetical protein
VESAFLLANLKLLAEQTRNEELGGADGAKKLKNDLTKKTYVRTIWV